VLKTASAEQLHHRLVSGWTSTLPRPEADLKKSREEVSPHVRVSGEKDTNLNRLMKQKITDHKLLSLFTAQRVAKEQIDLPRHLTRTCPPGSFPSQLKSSNFLYAWGIFTALDGSENPPTAIVPSEISFRSLHTRVFAFVLFFVAPDQVTPDVAGVSDCGDTCSGFLYVKTSEFDVNCNLYTAPSSFGAS
jgi:hypothetical protein